MMKILIDAILKDLRIIKFRKNNRYTILVNRSSNRSLTQQSKVLFVFEVTAFVIVKSSET